MRSYSTFVILSALLTVTTALAGCDSDQTRESTAPEAKQAEANQEQARQPADDEGPTRKPAPAPSRPEQTPEPLVEAFEAPADAVTSEGRFDALMKQGLADDMPQIGLLYASSGVDQPAVRIALAADGRGRWARGDGAVGSDLEASGEFELGEAEAATVASLVTDAWTGEVEYGPSAVDQSRVIIIRDGETARVFEHSSLPESLTELEALLNSKLPDRTP